MEGAGGLNFQVDTRVTNMEASSLPVWDGLVEFLIDKLRSLPAHPGDNQHRLQHHQPPPTRQQYISLNPWPLSNTWSCIANWILFHWICNPDL
jgi:hypothetical protein